MTIKFTEHAQKKFEENIKNKDAMILKIRDVISAYDFQGLLQMGAPEDEYDSEAEDIYNRLGGCKSVEDVQKVIYVVFAYMFTIKHAGELERYLGCAEDIWSLKK